MSVIIVNDNIILKPISLADKERLQLLANEPIMRKNVGDNMPYPYTLNDAEQWINYCQSITGSDTVGQYGIFIDGVYAGNIGRERKASGRKQYNYLLGYWLGKPYRGQSFMTEIVISLTTYMFSHLPCHRCYAFVFGRNEGSRRVLEKAGFICEGILKEGIYYEGVWHDEYLFGKVNPKPI